MCDTEGPRAACLAHLCRISAGHTQTFQQKVKKKHLKYAEHIKMNCSNLMEFISQQMTTPYTLQTFVTSVYKRMWNAKRSKPISTKYDEERSNALKVGKMWLQHNTDCEVCKLYSKQEVGGINVKVK